MTDMGGRLWAWGQIRRAGELRAHPCGAMDLYASDLLSLAIDPAWSPRPLLSNPIRHITPKKSVNFQLEVPRFWPCRAHSRPHCTHCAGFLHVKKLHTVKNRTLAC